MRKLLTYGGSFMVLATASHTRPALRQREIPPDRQTCRQSTAQRTANRHAKKLAGGVDTHAVPL